MDKQSSQKNSHVFLGVSILLGAWFIYSGLGKVSITTQMDTSSISTELNNIAYSLHPEQSKIEIDPKKKMLTEGEVVQLLGIMKSDLSMLLQQTDIPYIRIYEINYFPIDALDKWLLESGRKYNVQPK